MKSTNVRLYVHFGQNYFNINSIRGKKLELLTFLDFHQPHVVAIQETKIDNSTKLAHIVYIEKTEISMVGGHVARP